MIHYTKTERLRVRALLGRPYMEAACAAVVNEALAVEIDVKVMRLHLGPAFGPESRLGQIEDVTHLYTKQKEI